MSDIVKVQLSHLATKIELFVFIYKLPLSESKYSIIEFLSISPLSFDSISIGV